MPVLLQVLVEFGTTREDNLEEFLMTTNDSEDYLVEALSSGLCE